LFLSVGLLGVVLKKEAQKRGGCVFSVYGSEQRSKDVGVKGILVCGREVKGENRGGECGVVLWEVANKERQQMRCERGVLGRRKQGEGLLS
jgi:hypothetical protein